MGCLCKKISCKRCNPCDGTFNDAFNNLDCDAHVVVGACTKQDREANDEILEQLLDAICRLKGSICPADTVILGENQVQFFDNIVNASQVLADDIDFTGLSVTDVQVFLNGSEIYHEDIQTLSGAFVFDFNAGTQVVYLKYGALGEGTQGDPAPTGTSDVPSYIMIRTPTKLIFSDLLKCS